MSPEQNTGIEVPHVGATPAEVGHEAVEATAVAGMVEMPAAVAEQNAANTAELDAAAALAKSEAAEVAANIVATAPEMPAVDTAPSSRPATPEEAASVTATTPLYRPEAQQMFEQGAVPQPAAQESVK